MGTYEHGDAVDTRGLRVATVVARFNQHVTSLLEDGAAETLGAQGIVGDDAPVFRVPGAFELPVVAKRLAESGEWDAVICLGAVIRGDTPHFEYVAGECAAGLASLTAETGTPIAFGILTTNTVEQAIDRAGAKSGNKGFDAAMTAIEMANLLKALRQTGS